MKKVLEETFDNGEVTIRVHRTDFDTYVVADQAGWLSGEFETADEALAQGKRANGISTNA